MQPPYSAAIPINVLASSNTSIGYPVRVNPSIQVGTGHFSRMCGYGSACQGSQLAPPMN